ncbi:aminopeptidase N [Actinomyces minihominis]|uniref:aminopeptidase N n=1 Tax=Actinomyces minihominis TaxID=2002838 RepID=UPI000C089C47|nr:aminopeptidase N [Actinomyces minihominis]
MPGLNLTRTEAQERAAAVKRVESYDVALDLTTGDKTFRSTSKIVFEAVPGSETFLDLVVDKIHSASLNGHSIDPADYSDYRLPLRNLKEKNVVEVDADFIYMHTGEGLHRSVDPADGKVYLYTQFEVPDARRVYPTFEQPDLKSSFTFSVTTPEDFTVFSVTATPEPTVLEGGKKRFDFAPTQRISTYITAIVAGPYEGATSVIRSTDGREIDLGVYCRASLVKHLDSDLIMEITEQGFGFFENAYGIPYPFTKYDQIFVPEYNAGAMENAGCVTFRDQYIFRSKPTDWQLESRTNTILHELAHMWFGDLVTMQWWDDLWLNESFAEYMAHLATAEATRWSDAWVGFLTRKEWGLAQDQKPSTHPVKAEIRDLADVEVNFDGITYAKGAAVLRQMVAYVGRENFFNGLHQYLTKHAFQNATLSDLIEELEAASGRDMDNWVKVWVEEAGVTSLRPEIIVDPDGSISELTVVQEVVSPMATLRPHRLIVSGYDLNEDGSAVEKVFTEELDIDGARTVVKSASGIKRPAFILVNDGDLAYAKIRMDEDSLAFAIANITKFSDPLTRRVILAAAWDMTRDGEFPASRFLNLALGAARIETSVASLTALLRQIDTAVTSYVAPAHRAAQMAAVADGLIELSKIAEAGTDKQEMFVMAACRRAVTRAQFEYLDRLYRGEETQEGLVMSEDLRWAILFALVRGGLAGKEAVATLRAEDNTLTGEQNAVRALATIDSDAVRAETYEAVMHDVSIPNDTRWAMVAGFWAHVNTKPEAYVSYVEKFYDQIALAWEAHTFHIASGIVQHLEPLPVVGYLPEVDVVTRAQEWLDYHQERPDSLRRLIAEGRDDAQRMLKAQKADA